jgi:hypothetical protein
MNPMAANSAAALQPLLHDLQRIFGTRLDTVVGYGTHAANSVPSLVLVESLTWPDLEACAERSGAWHRHGCATPLLMTRQDFVRSLDAFPIEYGAILHDHFVVFGRDPFDGLQIRAEDLRRACEVQVKSHLLHLREDYLDGGGRRADVDALVRESAPGFAALLRHLARLDSAAAGDNAALVEYASRRVGLDAHLVGDVLTLADAGAVSGVDAARIFPSYLTAVERLADFVDRWRAS